MNRVMFVTALGRMAKVSADLSSTSGFKDVVNDGWSTGYIAWAYKNGIVTDYRTGRSDSTNQLQENRWLSCCSNTPKPPAIT